MALRPGMRLGHYEIVAPLGAGGMGEVYRARDERLGREVALKILPAQFAADAKRLERFEHEARAAAALNHPNILAVHDIGTHEGAPYVVFELLEGETLRERLRAGAIAARRAIEIARQVAQGLAAAHEKGIVHRDLKPENIFLTRDARVKILDFGLAKLTRPEETLATATSLPTVSAATDAGVVLGTVGYMSPEQARGRPADARSDLFAFGAVLYEMLSGQRAFRGETLADTLSAILKEEPPELPTVAKNIPPALDRVVRHCLEKNPEARFQSAHDIAFDLEALSTASSAATAATAGRASGPRRWGIPAAIAIAFLAGWFAAGNFRRRAAMPAFHRLTYERGYIPQARFAPDGKTVVYAATWNGEPLRLFTVSPEFPESRAMDFPAASLFAVSSNSELAMVANPKKDYWGVGWGTLSTLPLAGGAPRELLENILWADWSPDGTEMAVVRKVGAKCQIEYPVGKVIYQSRGCPSHLRVSPDGRQVAFLDHSDWPDNRGAVWVADRAGHARQLSAGWGDVWGLAWPPDGKEVWFTAARSGVRLVLYAVSLAGKLRVVARIPGGLVLWDISRTGQVLLSEANARLEQEGKAAGAKRERDLSWLDFSILEDISADGKTLLFTEQAGAAGRYYETCLRGMDGRSPPVVLGEGAAFSLSPDGKWAAAIVRSTPPRLVLLPTGPGSPRTLGAPGFESYIGPAFMPDGKKLLFAGSLRGHSPRGYIQDVAGGTPTPVTPEGVVPVSAPSPDGQSVMVMKPDGSIALYSLAEHSSRAISGLEPGERLAGWAARGHAMFVYNSRVLPAPVYQLDLTTGKRTLWKELAVPDPAGVSGIGVVVISPDGKSYAYDYYRDLSTLYVVTGLK